MYFKKSCQGTEFSWILGTAQPQINLHTPTKMNLDWVFMKAAKFANFEAKFQLQIRKFTPALSDLDRSCKSFWSWFRKGSYSVESGSNGVIFKFFI